MAQSGESDIDFDGAMFVDSSKYRTKTLIDLKERPATPSEIAESSGQSQAHVSRALQELREEDMVELLVSEDRKKGRLYGITNDGEAIAEWLENRE